MTDDPVMVLLLRRMDDQDVVLREILSEAKATNGRVTALEQAQAVEKALDGQQARAHAARSALLTWTIPTLAGVVGAFGAVLLAHFLT